MKYETVTCEGYWDDDPENIFEVTVALGEWDGIEDEEDRNIFYYMDGESIEVGMVISDGFVVTEVLGE